MCGVAGIFSYAEAAGSVDRGEMRSIRDYMTVRGPDGYGEWFSADGRVALGHRRLSIIDLSNAAAQPMTNEDGSVAISFNGEIYNYQELRRPLEQKGYRFRSQSDTEVLLHLYEDQGPAMFNCLRGMFALLLWDARQKKMLLARDPYGIKPLYYSDNGRTVKAASQVKALLCSPQVSRTPESAGIAGFFLMGSIPEPFTLYQEIRQVPAGSFIWIDSGGPSEAESYNAIQEVFCEALDEGQPVLPLKDELEKIHEAVTRSVRYHLVADVPVGLFLSSGIDSNIIAALATELKTTGIQAVTLAFEELKRSGADEAPLAAAAAKHLGLKHHTYLLTFQEFEASLTHFFKAMDQPSLDGLNTYFISKTARACGFKVALSGVGADELFGGYPSFRRIPFLVRNFSWLNQIPGVGRLFRRIWEIFLSEMTQASPKIAGLLTYGGDFPGAYFLTRGLFMPWELPALMEADLARDGLEKLGLLPRFTQTLRKAPPNAEVRVSMLESSWYLRNQLLRDTDWAGMAHSLEIRTPFVDSFLLKKLAGILARNRLWNKQLLVKAIGRNLLPALRKRKKTGFVLPMRFWLSQQRSIDQSWRRVPLLSGSHCPWQRRWAYSVYEEMTG